MTRKYIKVALLVLAAILVGQQLAIVLPIFVFEHDENCPLARSLHDFYRERWRLVAGGDRYSTIDGDAMIFPGDVVLDCGAYNGDTAARALQMGASLVVAIDPSQDSMKMLRTRLAREIAAGRVIPYEKGVLDKPGLLPLYENHKNRSADSFFFPSTGPSTYAQVTTLDSIVSELGLKHVDLIKMDIEGSEQKALLGARESIRKFHPRLAIASYHLADDFDRIATIVGSVSGQAYHLRCGRCLPAHHRVFPNLLYFI